MKLFPSTTLRKSLWVTAFIVTLAGCGVTPYHTESIYGHQQHDLRQECLRALAWRHQLNVDGLYDDDASEEDRFLSAMIHSTTNETGERLKCENLRQNYTLEAIPEIPKSKERKK